MVTRWQSPLKKRLKKKRITENVTLAEFINSLIIAHPHTNDVNIRTIS